MDPSEAAAAVESQPSRLSAAGPLAGDNPLAHVSDLPYSLPDFAAIRTEHLAPAIAAGLAEQRREWAAVGANREPATVENTLEAIERSGRLLGRGLSVFYALLSSRGDDALEGLEAEVSPALAAHTDAFLLDAAVFERLEALEAARREGALLLDDETAWLLHLYRKDFVRAGARLREQQQVRLRALNEEITNLETAFRQAVVAGMEDGAVAVDDAAQLAGLPADTVAALARNAQDRGRDGHLITLKLPTPQGVLESLANRGLRRRVHEASIARGSGVDPSSDTRLTLARLARLRAERARLLGYADHATYVVEDGTAGTTTAVTDLLARLAPPAVRNADAEAAELAAALEAEAPEAALEPWDWAFYSGRVRSERFDIDEAGLRPYLEAERVLRDGVFHAATGLYGVTFTDRPDLRGYADDVRVFEVREADGAGLGLYVLDLYARPGKRGGAWMTSLVVSSRLLGESPVVTNTLNVDHPAEGQPTLLSWDEVITLFHEFGHALHGLFSDVRYPSLSGTHVPRDFVEYPSQVNEMWATHPEVLASYARHHATGEPLAADVADRLRAAQRFGEGFRTTEYLAAAVLDQAWHRLGPQEVPDTAGGVEEFEAAALAAAGLDHPLVPPRYRSAYFNHSFGGGYDAAYYSYVWSEVLDADTVDWFTECGGLDRAAGERFRRELLARGHARDPLGFFRAGRGRDPAIEPL